MYLVLFWWIDAPPNKKFKKNQEYNNNSAQPSEEVLENLSQDIVSFWKSLGRKLKVPNAKLEEIQGDNVQYPGIKEKSFQMLSAWVDQGETATFGHLSEALKTLGKKKLSDKYCSTSWQHVMTDIKRSCYTNNFKMTLF